MSQAGRIERLLMTNVFAWVGSKFAPVSDKFLDLTADIRLLFFHRDDEIEGYDDNQLHMLGLDVEAMNDDEKYWEYSTRNTRTNRNIRRSRLSEIARRAGLG